MASTQDAQLGLAVESTPKTYVAPTRFLEYLDESLDWNPNTKQGQGLRVAKRVDRSARRVRPTADGGGDVTVEWSSKGLGLLLQACMGGSTSTLVSGSTYQQVHIIGDNPSTLTIQKGIYNAGSGVVDAVSFLGCAVSSFEITAPNGDIVTLKASIDAADITTAQSLAAASYPTEPVGLFSFVGGSISTGTLTAPTSTALGSAATPVADVRSASVAVNNNIRNDRFNFGASGRKAKQLTGKREITGSLEIEYDSTTFRDAFIADTPLCLLLQFVTTNALSTGVETLQIIVPEIKLDSALPMTNGTDLVVQSMSFTGLDNLTAAQPLWIVTRTADIAL